MGRHKKIEDADLLSIARQVFVEQGIGASTREIAQRAGISEAVIFQRHDTKTDLFFAAMAPPDLNIEELFGPRKSGEDPRQRLEIIALGMLDYFRKLMPVLLPLVTHPSFDFEDFAARHPDAPLTRVREGLVEYLEEQAEAGTVNPETIGPSGLMLVATLHSLAIFEKLGVHGGHFDEVMVRAIVKSLWQGLAPQT